jgi:hypothetical protein
MQNRDGVGRRSQSYLPTFGRARVDNAARLIHEYRLPARGRLCPFGSRTERAAAGSRPKRQNRRSALRLTFALALSAPPISADLRSWSQYRTSRQNDARTTGQHAHTGTYVLVVLVVLDTQNAGFGRGRAAVLNVVMARVGVRRAAPEPSFWS